MEKLRSTKLVWLMQQQATVSRHKNVFTQSQFCEIHSISLFRSYSVFVRQNTNYISTRNIEHFRSNYFEIYTYICIAAAAAAAAAKSLQSCPILWDPIDGSPAGSPIPGILQARTLEWVAISFSNAWKWKVKVKLLSRVWLLVTPWTAAYQAPLSMGFSRQEYWSGLPLPSPYALLVGV